MYCKQEKELKEVFDYLYFTMPRVYEISVGKREEKYNKEDDNQMNDIILHTGRCNWILVHRQKKEGEGIGKYQD